MQEIPLNSGAKLAYYIVDKLRTFLSTQITYLDFSKTYPIAKPAFVEADNHWYPRVHYGDGSIQFQDVRFDESVKSLIFFEHNNTSLSIPKKDIFDFSMIFWGNQNRIATFLGIDLDFDYTENIVYDIQQALFYKPNNFGIKELNIEYQKDRVWNMYPGLLEKYKKYMWFPYISFKINFIVDASDYKTIC